MENISFIPKVGQLLYYERFNKDGSSDYVSLIFIDEPIIEGKQWLYTQIALMDDFGQGMEVYTGIESGGMPPGIVRPATDEDIQKFIDQLLKNPGGKAILSDWKRAIVEDNYISPEEKERLLEIILLN